MWEQWRQEATKFTGDVAGETSAYHTKETMIIESERNWKAKVHVYVAREEWALVPNKFLGYPDDGVGVPVGSLQSFLLVVLLHDPFFSSNV